MTVGRCKKAVGAASCGPAYLLPGSHQILLESATLWDSHRPVSPLLVSQVWPVTLKLRVTKSHYGKWELLGKSRLVKYDNFIRESADSLQFKARLASCFERPCRRRRHPSCRHAVFSLKRNDDTIMEAVQVPNVTIEFAYADV